MSLTRSLAWILFTWFESTFTFKWIYAFKISESGNFLWSQYDEFNDTLILEKKKSKEMATPNASFRSSARTKWVLYKDNIYDIACLYQDTFVICKLCGFVFERFNQIHRCIMVMNQIKTSIFSIGFLWLKSVKK